MIPVLLCIMITALLCNGITIATSAGQLLYPIRKMLDKVALYEVSIPDSDETEIRIRKIYKPILYCVKCMPSVYGTGVSLLFLPLTWNLLWQIPIIVFCSVALSTIVSNLYD